MSAPVPAVAFAVLAGLVALFQIALVIGAPWGAATLGGRHPGRLPASMRGVALVSGLLLVLMSGVVLVRAGLLLPAWYPLSRRAIWGVVGISALTCAANTLSPSTLERRLWVPVGLAMLGCSLWVALH